MRTFTAPFKAWPSKSEHHRIVSSTNQSWTRYQHLSKPVHRQQNFPKPGRAENCKLVRTIWKSVTVSVLGIQALNKRIPFSHKHYTKVPRRDPAPIISLPQPHQETEKILQQTDSIAPLLPTPKIHRPEYIWLNIYELSLRNYEATELKIHIQTRAEIPLGRAPKCV